MFGLSFRDWDKLNLNSKIIPIDPDTSNLSPPLGHFCPKLKKALVYSLAKAYRCLSWKIERKITSATLRERNTIDMGDAVFGNPITNSTLKGLPEFVDNDIIKSTDRACVALNMKNAEEKNVRALQYLEKLKEKCGVDLGTLCLLYNATGDTIKFVTHKNRYGNIGASPYPMEIANGQWGAFLHVKKSPGPNSVGAVVYRGKDPTGVECDWLVSWDNPDSKDQWNTKAYAEVREIDHFLPDSTWGKIYDLMQSSGIFHDSTKDNDNRKGCSLSVSIGNDHFPIAVAVFTLQDV